MIAHSFRRNPAPTLGVELELQIVDARSMALRGAVADVLAGLPPWARDSVKPEFHACCVEISTGVCGDVDAARRDLEPKLEAAERAAGRLGLRLAWGGTHPFGHWLDQPIVPTPRYRELADQYRETLLRQLTFGLHVHVGVADGDAAIRACNRVAGHLPALLALSANSPFWCGRATGLHSHRAEVLASAPIGGHPPRVRDWDEYARLVNRLAEAGSIRSLKDLWWDVRPSPEFGTVEVRICDMPLGLPDALALAAVIQCLVHALSRPGAEGPADVGALDVVHRQNRWRAARHGLDAVLVEPVTGRTLTARRWVGEWGEKLAGTSEELGCSGPFADALGLAREAGGSGRQLAVFDLSGCTQAVARYQAGDRAVGVGAAGWGRPALAWPPGSWDAAAIE